MVQLERVPGGERRDCPGREREKQAGEEGIPRWRGPLALLVSHEEHRGELRSVVTDLHPLGMMIHLLSGSEADFDGGKGPDRQR
jgi:hypothetical protein